MSKVSEIMGAPAISIIVPVYNSEEYLDESIGSILNQTFQDFEVLLIDDGSKDRSGAICDAFSEQDSRVRVYHKENGGICSARNYALERAKGEYITFMDNDDELYPTLFEDNYALAKSGNYDIVRFGNYHTITIDGKEISRKVYSCPNQSYNSEEMKKQYMDFHVKFTKAVWTALFKRELLNDNHIRFDERMKYGYEDRDFFVRTLLAAKSIAGNPNAYYVWKQRETHSTSMKKGIHILENRLECLKIIGENEYSLIEKNGIDKYPVAVWEKILGTYYIRTLVDILYTSGGWDMKYSERKQYWNNLRDRLFFKNRTTAQGLVELLRFNKFAFARVVLFYLRQYRLIEIMYCMKK